ncbi:unnamed protein product [Kuraishia capsulata CBS 1993]|uniref:Major facilitator superfamily (MFS) profile domain-containing protein n=1 Tax=Kuraishia capsulata CBS 1993 TaxID=1382522 RepID=W6MPC7_9ASCO|nr:uncharacterized protein KUCA_T00002944001 [Kuraishia capsulata CBS 1993]CDK26967.1 unnamed protein product [Kuraishia capsulata CBS 1993]
MPSDTDNYSTLSSKEQHGSLPESFTAEEPPTTYQPEAIKVARTNSRASQAESDPMLDRELSRRLTNADSVATDVRKQEESGEPIPPMGNGKPYPPPLPDSALYTVSYDGPDDPLHPHNWALRRKVIAVLSIGFHTFSVAFGSALFSSAIPYLDAQFHVASVVSTLGVSLYVLGFASGPILWAPLSELYGRKPVLVISIIITTCFHFGAAAAKDFQTIMLCRFFAGFFGAAPLAVVPASFADLFGNETRGYAVACFSMAVFVGPMLAPIAGGFISSSYLGWRWTEYIIGIMSAASIGFDLIFYEETHHPIILVEKARTIKRRTGIWGIHAPHDEFQLSIREIAEKNITRPLVMLFTEPVILLVTIYNAFIYGILYLFLTAYPIVFAEGYGFASGVAELPYIALIIGMLFGGIYIIHMEKFYLKMLKENGGKPVPEARLPGMIFGAVAFPIGLLWFTWTGNYHEHIHWIVPTLSGLFSGFGLIVIFIPSLNYIVDSYLIFAASALAGNTFLRSGFGAAFPMFASFMFHGMGTNWAGLLIGLFAAALIPVPLFFLKYGKRLRERSKYAFVL